ncbi:MAG: hypothetical protein K6T75_06095 [Acetobacteraceae bacterium]|nr:hypothetical protein [Acetobacteraceae bacterium]
MVIRALGFDVWRVLTAVLIGAAVLVATLPMACLEGGGFPGSASGGSGVSRSQAVAVARQHLQECGRYPDNVKRVEVVEGMGAANHYWDGPEQVAGQELKPRPCWIVTFIHDAHHPDHRLTVYVDKATGQAIGGEQCR